MKVKLRAPIAVNSADYHCDCWIDDVCVIHLILCVCVCVAVIVFAGVSLTYPFLFFTGRLRM